MFEPDYGARYTLYEPWLRYYQLGFDQSVSQPVYYQGALVEPTAVGTFELLTPNGDTLESCAISVVGSVPTASVSASSLVSTLPRSHRYMEVWPLTLGGEEMEFRRPAAVAVSVPLPQITDRDILSVYTDLARQQGPGGASFQPYIDEAWRRTQGRLEQGGLFPEAVISSYAIREFHLEMTLHLVTLDYAQTQGGQWMELAQHHKKEAEFAWQRFSSRVDFGGDGLADSDTMYPSGKGVTFQNRPPGISWGGGFGI